VVDFDQNDPEYLQAMQSYLSGSWEEALEEFTHLEVKYPGSTYIQLLLGNVNYSIGNLDDAFVHYEAGTKIKPDFYVAYYKMGVCSYRTGRMKMALEYFNKVLECKDGGHGMASYFIGLIYFFMGKYDKALEGFSQLRKKSPQSKIANYYLAQIKIKREEYDDAIALLEELLENSPDFADVHYLLGDAYYRSHNNMKAIASLKTALEKNPDEKRARNLLEYLTM
jgi:tetratricopeptide (TPR) repeat protein